MRFYMTFTKKSDYNKKNGKSSLHEGVLLVNKSKGVTSFSLVRLLRSLTKISKIGHAGTLDPQAEGLMILLIGSKFTKQSAAFINLGKEYEAEIYLGKTTDTYDAEGKVLQQNTTITPSQEQLETTLQQFQGESLQTPPMFSAKKVGGKKLYELARQNIAIERKPALVTLHITLQSYSYPIVKCHIRCSKGTYIRSFAHDLGHALGCGGYLFSLTRTSIGPFSIKDALTEEELVHTPFSHRYIHSHQALNLKE